MCSRYVKQGFDLHIDEVRSNARWNVSGTSVRPNGILTYWLVPACHVNVVLCWYSGFIRICQYPEMESEVQRAFARPTESMHYQILALG